MYDLILSKDISNKFIRVKRSSRRNTKLFFKGEKKLNNMRKFPTTAHPIIG